MAIGTRHRQTILNTYSILNAYSILNNYPILKFYPPLKTHSIHNRFSTLKINSTQNT